MTEAQPTKTTLSEFIENHSKLVSSVAAFVALTVFASQFDNDLRLFFSALSLFCAVILAIELMRQVPPGPNHWRLTLFADALAPLVALLVWYWFSKFQAVWIPLGFQALQLIVLIAVGVLFSKVLTLCVSKLARLVKKEISQNALARVSQGTFLLSILVVTGAVIWVSRKLATHPIVVKFPNP